MKTNKIILPSKYYSLNEQLKPGIQIQNFFRVDHNAKFQQNPLKITNKNSLAKKKSSHHYEIIYSPRSKSKERDSDNSYINKPKIIINNLPPEFNITTNSNNNNYTNINNDSSVSNNFVLKNGNDKVINNFLLGMKTDIKNRENSAHCLKNIHNNRSNNTTYYNNNSSKNEINNNSNITINNNNINHYNTEGSELENYQNLSSIGFKSFNNVSIKNRGKTVLKYNKYEFYNGNLSEIAEIINKKRDTLQKKDTKETKVNNIIKISVENKKIKNHVKNGLRPIKLNNYNNNFQRKVIPPIMHKFNKINFDSDSLFSFKRSQISNLNNFNYSKLQKNNSNININSKEKQQGKTFSNFKNGIKYNLDIERKSFSGKNIDEDNSKGKVISRPNSEDNNKTNFETNNNNEFNEKEMTNKKIQELLLYKKSPSNLNNGLFYKNHNGYKFYFDFDNIDCYIFKDIESNISKNNILKLIESWQKNYKKCTHFVKILGFKKFNSQKNYSIILEHPNGGENFNDIINAIGFYDLKLLLNISQIIYECLSNTKSDKNNKGKIFCICDIYLNINNHIKIIPPFIRSLLPKTLCQCKSSIKKFEKIFNYDSKDISLFCFGFSLIQLITQNLLFKMRSFNYLIRAEKEKYTLCFKKCCFLHTLLNIENKLCDKKSDLLLTNFFDLYPECIKNFIHICTQFKSIENLNIIYKHEFLNMYDAENHIDIQLKEILKILNFDSKFNYNQINYETFLEKFEALYKSFDINQYVFSKIFRYKILNNLKRAFNINDKNELNKLLNIFS